MRLRFDMVLLVLLVCLVTVPAVRLIRGGMEKKRERDICAAHESDFASVAQYVYSNHLALASTALSDRWTITPEGFAGISNRLPPSISIRYILIVPNMVHFRLGGRYGVDVLIEAETNGAIRVTKVRWVGDGP